MAKAKILVVDDDLNWTLKVSDSLMQHDYEVFSANTTQDSLLLLEAHSIDLVIAEINLPQVDGISFLEQLRQVHPDATVLVCTLKPSIPQAVQATRLLECGFASA